LVHPAATRLAKISNVLVLGGGDGLALRELAKYSEIKQIVLVDLDPAMVRLGRTDPILRKLNADAFANPVVKVIHDDAFEFVENTQMGPFDLVIVDLPDPHHESLAKLYSVTFYQSLMRVVAEGGLVAAQLGSPFLVVGKQS
jgi:spermidine synthase